MSLPHVEREHDGKLVRFRKMTPYDRSEVVRKYSLVRAADRAALKRDLADASAPKEEMIATLQDFDSRTKSMTAFNDAIDTPDGRKDLFDLSLCSMTLAGPSNPKWELTPDHAAAVEYLGTLSSETSADLAAELCNLPPIKRDAPAEDDEQEADANPTTPPTTAAA